jgi:hypothetical protein
MGHERPLVASDVNDPERTKAGLKSRSAAGPRRSVCAIVRLAVLDSEQFRSDPRTCRPLRVRLSLR